MVTTYSHEGSTTENNNQQTTRPFISLWAYTCMNLLVEGMHSTLHTLNFPSVTWAW